MINLNKITVHLNMRKDCFKRVHQFKEALLQLRRDKEERREEKVRRAEEREEKRGEDREEGNKSSSGM